MRGIDFYNIPTTVLSQVDSSVGGKTGVNLDGIKNIIGAFKQPKGVIIDVDLLKTLPARQISNGLSEAVKMALTFDPELFFLLEKESAVDNLENIISRSISLKISVVEQDEKESGLRKVLNFGHTVGHGIESLGLGYYHGECVALGMIYMCSDEVKARLIPVLKRLDLPTEAEFDREAVLVAVSHDKKSVGDGVSAVTVNKIGTFEIKKYTMNELRAIVTGK
jgi:3-dehydroquinate synthase